MADMTEEDYPALYRAADAASVRAQNTFLNIIRVQSIVLVTGAALGTIGVHSTIYALLSAAIFLVGIFISVLMALRRYEATWYRARAVAESVKTSTWRFMMRAEPFDKNMPTAEALGAFRSMLRRILNEHTDLGAELGGPIAAADQVTDQMRAMRDQPLEGRKLAYRQDRIDDQRNWYARKSSWNALRATCWLWLFIALQAGAVIVVLMRIAMPTFDYWPVEVLAVAAASTLTWLQLKRFRELAAAYSLAAHEIGVLRGELDVSLTDEQFSDFVGDAESAFSREHTQWVARKDVRA